MRFDLSRIPKDVTRRERLALFALLLVADDYGQIEGGKRELMRILDVSDPEETRATLASLEARGFVKRVAKRLFVRHTGFLPYKNTRPCEGGCGRMVPVPKDARPSRPGATHCGSCRQRARADRAWIPQAITLAVWGKTPPEIAFVLGQPLWRPREDNEGQTTAVVPLLLSQGLVGDEWREALANVVGADQARMLVKDAGGSL